MSPAAPSRPRPIPARPEPPGSAGFGSILTLVNFIDQIVNYHDDFRRWTSGCHDTPRPAESNPRPTAGPEVLAVLGATRGPAEESTPRRAFALISADALDRVTGAWLWTRALLGWEPTHESLLEDLRFGDYITGPLSQP